MRQRIQGMEKQELVEYWTKTAESDHRTMQHLFDSEDYHWALFTGLARDIMNSGIQIV